MVIEILQILFDGLCVGLASSVTVGPVAVLCIQRTLSKGHLSGIMSGAGIAVADTLMAILAFTVYSLLKSSIDEYNTIIQLCGGVFVVIVGIFIFFKNPVPQIRKNRSGRSYLWQDFISMFGFTMANFVVIIPYILAFFTMFNIDLSIEEPQPQPVIETLATKDTPHVEHIPNLSISEAEVSLDEAIVATDTENSNIDNTTDTESHTPAPEAPHGKRLIRNSLVLLGFFLGAMAWWVALTSLINLFRRGFRPRHLLTINRVAGIIISTLGLYTLISVIIS